MITFLLVIIFSEIENGEVVYVSPPSSTSSMGQ